MSGARSQYSDPELREQVKAEILASDKGGRPGQWSARKAQLVAAEYKRRGGGYTSDKEHESEAARHLDAWTEEEWQTVDGRARAREGDRTHRYLPKAAWEQLSDEEKRATEQAKLAADRQFVPNTPAAAEAGRAARLPFAGYDQLTVAQVVERLDELDRGTLEHVHEHEQATKARRGVLERVERLLS